VALLAKATCDELGELALVLDDQHMHSSIVAAPP
jgi:hypothetical protein